MKVELNRNIKLLCLLLISNIYVINVIKDTQKGNERLEADIFKGGRGTCWLPLIYFIQLFLFSLAVENENVCMFVSKKQL